MDAGTRILDRDGHHLHIMDQADGKLILLITGTDSGAADGYTIGLAAGSLAGLRTHAATLDFDWTHRDGSLRIVGRGAVWVLTFKMLEPPYAGVTIELTRAETAAARKALIDGTIN